jgi:hypothetical protein
MRNRLIFGTTILGLISLVLFVPDVYKYLIVYFGWCKNIDDQMCMGKNFLWLSLCWLVLAVFILFISEKLFQSISKDKNKNVFDIKEYDSTPYMSSIGIINKSYPLVENCSVELVCANVLNNQGCRSIFNEEMNIEKIPKLFIWESGSVINDLPKNIHGKVEIVSVTTDEKVAIKTNREISYFPIYQNGKKGRSAKRATYQIKIKVSGKVDSDGIESIIEDFSFWEIGYSSDGYVTSQNIWIKKIEKLREANNLSLGEPIPQVFKMAVTLNKNENLNNDET